MLEYYLYGFGVRLGETIIYASLWVLTGLFIAAVMRHMMGPAKVRAVFGEGTRRGIFTGWLIGMLLPVCSLGVIPIVRELHRCGVRSGTLVAFGLTAPLFNPMSVLYGLTMSDPIAILSFSLFALLIVTVLGILWNRIASETTNVEPNEMTPPAGIKRIAALFHTMARETIGPSMGFIAIGVLLSVFTATLLEKGYLQNRVERDNAFAPVTVAVIALPIYSTPLLAMSQIGGMFQHGNSIGAAFSLLILGAGANLGIAGWFAVSFGWRRMLIFLTVLATTTVSLAYIIDKPLYPKGVEPAGHSHAFDVYTHPFHKREKLLPRKAKTKLTEFWQSNELGSTKLLGGLFLAGIIVCLVGNKRIEHWLYSTDGEQERKYDLVVPSWILGGTTISGLVALSIVGSYFYYPSPEDLLPQLFRINNECIYCANTEKWEGAEKWIPYADDLSRRLEVGVLLRNGSVESFKTAKAKIYRDKLDRLKQSVEQRDPTNIKDLAFDLSEAYRRLSKAFRQETDAK